MSISPKAAQVHDPRETRQQRALPTDEIDLIRRGVPGYLLRQKGQGAIWGALVGTAMSAQQREQGFIDWSTLICSSRSRLGQQARSKDGKREYTPAKFQQHLRDAWERASELILASPAFTKGDVLAKIATVRDWVADADSPIGDTDRAVLAYAVEVAERNGTDRPTMPLREVAEATGLGVKAVRLALARLDKAHLLVLELRGMPGGPNSTARRASAYRLASADVLAAHSTAPQVARTAAVVAPVVALPQPSAPAPFADADDEEIALLRRALAEHRAAKAAQGDDPAPAAVLSLASYRKATR